VAATPTLQAERNVNWELALDKHLPNEAGVLGANLYLRRTEDFIERRTATRRRPLGRAPLQRRHGPPLGPGTRRQAEGRAPSAGKGPRCAAI
jgi:hypothetical protein